MSKNQQNNTIKASLSYGLFIDGNDITEDVDIISMNIHKQFCKIATADVMLYYGSVLNEEYIDQDTEDFNIGKEIEISAGEDDTVIFKGIIVKKSISLSNKKSLLKLTAKNKAYKMTLNRFNHVFSEKTDSEIIEELIQKYGIESEIDATSYKNETSTQYNCSDWDFINIKAELNAMLVLTDDDKILVKKPVSGTPALEINAYDSIIELDAQMDGRTSFSDYKANSWNYNNQEKQEVEQSNSSDNFTQGSQPVKKLAENLKSESYHININSYFIDSDIMTEKINAAIMKNNLSRIIGTVSLYGVNYIIPGETVNFEGIGENFNGDAYVTELHLEYDEGAWKTRIGFGMEETSYFKSYDDINSAPASELMPAVSGLQIGKVIAIEGDPTDDFRLKISLPCFSGDNTEVWARLALQDAGNKRGCFFIPEIDDEVILGFVDQNPTNPVVLGSLYSGKTPPPQELSDDNNKKGFYLKSGIKLEFNEEDKIINIETPGDNKLIMNDKDGKIEIGDANGNQIIMDKQGIIIKSAGKLSIEAGSDMNLKGVNMTSEASASYKAKGNANTEISSSGVMVVKGSLVQIN